MSVGTMDILKVILGFFCSQQPHPVQGQAQPVRMWQPEFQKKVVLCLQNAFDAGEITVDFEARRHPSPHCGLLHWRGGGAYDPNDPKDF